MRALRPRQPPPLIDHGDAKSARHTIEATTTKWKQGRRRIVVGSSGRRRRAGADQGDDAGDAVGRARRMQSADAYGCIPRRFAQRHHLHIGIPARSPKSNHNQQRGRQPRRHRAGRRRGQGEERRGDETDAQGLRAEQGSDPVPARRAHTHPQDGGAHPVVGPDRGIGTHRRGGGRARTTIQRGNGRVGGRDNIGGGNRRGGRSAEGLEPSRGLSRHGVHAFDWGCDCGGVGGDFGAGNADEGIDAGG
mmetsp:Transcript_6998/g.15442  ORF Transcript_6998/g.15442 Transcript_6998/m.15442 type:complete len:248 (+) Transcript_6998:480-1223(+)